MPVRMRQSLFFSLHQKLNTFVPNGDGARLRLSNDDGPAIEVLYKMKCSFCLSTIIPSLLFPCQELFHGDNGLSQSYLLVYLRFSDC